MRFVITNSGGVYTTDFQELLEPVGVSTVTYKEETHLTGNTNSQETKGYQFYITTDMAPAKNNYYYWDIEETYQYHSAYPIEFFYDGYYVFNTPTNKFGLPRTIDHDTLFYCYKSGKVKQRFTYTTEHLTTAVIEDLALHFVPFLR